MQKYAGSWQGLVVKQGWKKMILSKCSFQDMWFSLFILLNHVSLKYLIDYMGEKNICLQLYDINLPLQLQRVSLNPQQKRESHRQRFQRGMYIIEKMWEHFCFRRNTALSLSTLLLTVMSVSELTHQVISSCWQPHIVVKTQCDKSADCRKMWPSVARNQNL